MAPCGSRTFFTFFSRALAPADAKVAGTNDERRSDDGRARKMRRYSDAPIDGVDPATVEAA